MNNKSIIVNNKILYSVDQGYYIPSDPGILRDYFSYAANIEEQDVKTWLLNNREINFCFDYTGNTSFRTFLNTIYHKLGITTKARYFLEGKEYARLYVLIDGMLIAVDNKRLKVGAFINKNGLSETIQTFLVYEVSAGDVWEREDGIRYYMNSNEQGHNEPHLHVDYRHERRGTFSIITGEMLAGNLYKKTQRSVKKRILNNQGYLVDFWNMHTNGLTVDLNHYFGITGISKEGSNWD